MLHPVVLINYTIIRTTMDSVCQSHKKKQKLYCETCTLSICWKCVPSHPNHSIDNISAILEQTLCQLQDIESVFRKLSSQYEILLSKADELHSLCSSSSDSSASLSSLSEQLSLCKAMIVEHIPQARGLTPEKFIETHKEVFPVDRPYLHWQEWGEPYLHIIDLESKDRSCQSLPGNRRFPLFSKGIAISFNRILICGGRKEVGSPELTEVWVIHLGPEIKIEDFPAMSIGKSNLNVTYCNNSVYVLSGCADNKPTRHCEKLDLATLEWSQIADCVKLHDAGSACNSDGFIYLCGGRDDTQVFSSVVEKYSIAENTWTVLSVKIPFAANLSGTIILPNNPNQLLIISGQDVEKKPINLSAILDISEDIAVESFEIPVKGGSIVDTVMVFEEQVFFYVLRNYCSRILEAWNYTTRQWTTISRS